MSPSALGPLPIAELDVLMRQCLDPKTRIAGIDWRYLTEPGENFGSLIFAVSVTIAREEVDDEEMSLVVKLPPSSAYLQDLFNSPVTFDKELRFYRDVVPALRSLELAKGLAVAELSQFAPRFYAGRLGLRDPERFDDQAAIVLENLSEAGYATRSRHDGLDEDHARFAVRELARVHATAIALKLERPETFARLVSPSLRPFVNDTAAGCLRDMITKARADLRGIEEIRDLVDVVERTLDYAARERTPSDREDPWKTLLHNDFWVNNMLFRYDANGRPTAMKIVDFQLCLYDYGAKDLIFFLMSSARESVVDESLNDLIDLYYDSFLRTLRSLKVDETPFARDEFDRILRSCAPIKFEQSIFMAQVIKATKGNDKSEGGKNGDDTPSFLSATGSVYREKLIHVVRTFERKGWLVK